MDTAFFIRALGAIFAIMNPFATLPLFLSLTSGLDPAAQRATALKVVAMSSGLCAAIMLGGTWILKFFGISVEEFRVAGGLVLLLIALGMLRGGDNPAHAGTPEERRYQAELSSIAFYPISFPLIVGPGTITTIIVFTAQAKGVGGYVAVIAALAAVMAAMAVVLWFATAIGRLMSQTLRTIVTRLMGMILAAIAVGMIAAGLKALLPGLAAAAG